MSTDYYDNNADAFYGATVEVDMSSLYEPFLKCIPSGGCILDAGCGSGRDAAFFLQAGFQVEAFDGSLEMVHRASALTGLEVKHSRFEAFACERRYHGIWACASLLHVQLQKLPDAVTRLASSLREGGTLYASFKRGTGEKQRGERRFTDLQEPELQALFENAGLNVKSIWTTQDLRPGRESEPWVNGLATR